MTNRATLEALLARVLEGTGPDRELDAEIAWLTHPSDRKRLGPPDLRRECFHLGLPEPQWVSWESVASFHPAYTGSLDAALTLVPEGWHSLIGARPDWPWVQMWEFPLPCRKVPTTNAPTIQRALIAACLKAMIEALGE